MIRHILSVLKLFIAMLTIAHSANSSGTAIVVDSLPLISRSIQSSGDIIIRGLVSWEGPACLDIQAAGNIIIESTGKFRGQGNTCLSMAAGVGDRTQDLISRGRILIETRFDVAVDVKDGSIRFYYVPEQSKSRHKYFNPGLPVLKDQVLCNQEDCMTSYMLVDTAEDLQNINLYLSGNYALSHDIDLSSISNFSPLKDASTGKRGRPFSGKFDGRGLAISGLKIALYNEDKVGLFGMCGGFKDAPATIENFVLIKPQVKGDTYVGSVVGWATDCHMSNVRVYDPVVEANDIAGGIIGTGFRSTFDKILAKNVSVTAQLENRGAIIGTSNKCRLDIVPIPELLKSIANLKEHNTSPGRMISLEERAKRGLDLVGHSDDSYVGFLLSSDVP